MICRRCAGGPRDLFARHSCATGRLVESVARGVPVVVGCLLSRSKQADEEVRWLSDGVLELQYMCMRDAVVWSMRCDRSGGVRRRQLSPESYKRKRTRSQSTLRESSHSRSICHGLQRGCSPCPELAMRVAIQRDQTRRDLVEGKCEERLMRARESGVKMRWDLGLMGRRVRAVNNLMEQISMGSGGGIVVERGSDAQEMGSMC